MFTGIVEETGTIQAIKKTGLSMALTIAASKVTSDVKLGDSIAVNGICLTVTGFSDNQFTVDVMPETVKATSLNGLSKGSKVNLKERCPPTDGSAATLYQGTWTERRKLRGSRKSNAVYYDLKLSPELTKTLVLKGSITVDGVSLTIFGLSDESVTVSIIPHTISETIFQTKTVGSTVNIECDMIGKYLYRFLHKTEQMKSNQTITEAFLSENGF